HQRGGLPITTVRVIVQIFFFVTFCWFVVVNTFGTAWFQKRGWNVNLFFNLDPLIALTTALSTHRIFGPLAWSLVILIPTLFLGRFFCGWICPFGSLHHFVSRMLYRGPVEEQVKANRYRKIYQVKYLILTVMVVMAIGNWGNWASLQIGWLDPFSLFSRSINTAILPAVNALVGKIYTQQPLYQGAWLIGIVFLTLVGLNMVIPRFFCRVLCPLGALLGVFSRFSLWRIEHRHKCSAASLCQRRCPGGCRPHGKLLVSECMVCFNCLDDCPEHALTFATSRPEEVSGFTPVPAPDVTGRRVVLAAAAGIITLPITRLSGASSRNWNPKVIRPPGSLPEEEFLKACLKCGQCMRACPTNVLQPAALEAGVEGIWTPILNNRIGRGCMLDCTACSQVCPTAAITPITIERKRGLGKYTENGPLRLGTSFVDRNRCLPWAMDKPCGVCEEVCPVSPKAIFMRTSEITLRMGEMPVTSYEGTKLEVNETLPADRFSGGDYRCAITQGPGSGQSRRIVANSENAIRVDTAFDPVPTVGSKCVIRVLVARPFVDPDRCIGCGLCEHECPVSGLRAIRVTAENESRSKERSLLLRS
ncbi:MAG: 4Fe-4S binding protein, partial [Sedimentisphaerales bacterium]|nr:4Fe-4S binding protein [Sedimentisphaerales bacterium]